jgi:hypothetical protein
MEHDGSWVTVREATVLVGVSESRIRAAYRSGALAVFDDLVGGRLRKVLERDAVLVWAGMPVPEPIAPPNDEVPAADGLIDTPVGRVAEEALERARRAEREVVFLRNEFAQLHAAHTRVAEELDRQSQARFEATTRAACTEAIRGRARRRFAFFAGRSSA